MDENTNRKYALKLSFEEIRLPPFDDILVLGKKNPQGKIGLYKSFELLVPNEYEVVEIDDNAVEAVFINKRLLKKIEKTKILSILQNKVFPFVSESEILKVELKIRVFYDEIETELL